MKKSIKLPHITSFFALFFFFSSCSKDYEPLPTVEKVDLEKYQGVWYEIAKLPNRFEKGLTCITAEYTILENGNIQVVNKGLKDGDPNNVSSVTGKAKRKNEGDNTKLKVSFFGPFYGDYYIIDLSENYEYALVGEPSREYLWILSRTPKLEKEIVDDLLEKAKKLGFDTSKVEMAIQDCY